MSHETWTCDECGHRRLVVDRHRCGEGYPGLCVGCSTVLADDSPKLAVVDWLIGHLRAELERLTNERNP